MKPSISPTLALALTTIVIVGVISAIEAKRVCAELSTLLEQLDTLSGSSGSLAVVVRRGPNSAIDHHLTGEPPPP